MVAPTTIPSHFTGPAWEGAAIISLIWFLLRWKTNLFTRGWAMKLSKDIDRDKLRKLDKLSSGSLLMFGGMLFSNSFGVLAPLSNVLTAGAALTAFASVNILRDVLGGLNVHFGELFSVGDTIQVGNIGGEVLEIGLTTTKLLLHESLPPKLVPNSLFNPNAFLITLKPFLRDMVSIITVQVDDIEKIRQVSEEIKSMMKSHASVSMAEMLPYCNPSAVGRHRLELTFGCTLKHVSEEGLVAAEQDVIRQSREIIKKHGATVVKTVPSINNDDPN